MNEINLINRFCDGDKSALKEIHDRYATLLRIRAFRILRDQDEATIVVEKMLAVFWNNRRKMRKIVDLKEFLCDAVEQTSWSIADRPHVVRSLLACVGEKDKNRVNWGDITRLINQLEDKLYPAEQAKMAVLYVVQEKDYFEISCEIRYSPF
ncbi:hypothetical protein, partial [[Flexibacter] sp. ATCC 35208]|uniref:hypothetical protein n=1 Tax=[Flexibacter] sp. ATCC 35208 TaxID=1936242 RepID=UPI0009D349C9